jgi:hypothetical protein
VAKKYTNIPVQVPLLVKEQSQAQIAKPAPHYTTPEMMQKTVSPVMKIHGTALQELAK